MNTSTGVYVRNFLIVAAIIGLWLLGIKYIVWEVKFANVALMVVVFMFIQGASFLYLLKYNEEYFFVSLAGPRGSLITPEPVRVGIYDLYYIGGYTLFTKNPGKDALVIVPRIGNYTRRFGNTVFCNAYPRTLGADDVPPEVRLYLNREPFPAFKIWLALDKSLVKTLPSKISDDELGKFQQDIEDKQTKALLYQLSNSLNNELVTFVQGKYDALQNPIAFLEVIDKSFNDPSKRKDFMALLDKLSKDEKKKE